MSRHRFSIVVGVALVLLVAPSAFAAKAQPAICSLLLNLSPPVGVVGDGVGIPSDRGDVTGVYDNGVGKVQCFFGVNGVQANLVTYTSGRKLHFTFKTDSAAFIASNLGADVPSGDFYAEVDFSGTNYYDSFRNMGINTTAQVSGDLEFYVGRVTYELDYRSLAAKRIDATTFLITTEPFDICGTWDCYASLGFKPSDEANLNTVRRRSIVTFGKVNMPLRFEMKFK